MFAFKQEDILMLYYYLCITEVSVISESMVLRATTVGINSQSMAINITVLVVNSYCHYCWYQ